MIIENFIVVKWTSSQERRTYPWEECADTAPYELALRFTDPATQQLRPGVRETIRTGSNLFVTYPGYSDYRHIPVVGKGVSFQLPRSPGPLGMICEADLEEVYRRRSLSYGLRKPCLATMAGLLACNFLAQHYSGLEQSLNDICETLSMLTAAVLFSTFGPIVAARSLRINSSPDIDSRLC